MVSRLVKAGSTTLLSSTKPSPLPLTCITAAVVAHSADEPRSSETHDEGSVMSISAGGLHDDSLGLVVGGGRGAPSFDLRLR